MKLEIFKEYIEVVTAASKYHLDLSEYLSDTVLDNLYDPCNSLVNLLSDIFEDECDWIGYWLYELEAGTKYKDGSVTIDDKVVKLETVAELYKVLVEGQLAKQNKGCF